MFCRYCGKSVKSDSIFCAYCGRQIGDRNDWESLERKVSDRVNEDMVRVTTDTSPESMDKDYDDEPAKEEEEGEEIDEKIIAVINNKELYTYKKIKNTRDWLKENGHPDLALKLGKYMEELEKRGEVRRELKIHPYVLQMLWIMFGVLCGLAVLCASFGFPKMKSSKASLYGTWYKVEGDGGALSDVISFNRDGGFMDGSIGATYSADKGNLVLYYNAMAGTYAYEYEVKNRTLYLYRRGELYYVFKKKSVIPIGGN